MIVVDVNLLIYAHNAGADQHRRAREWVEAAFTGAEAVRIPWAVVHAFLRLTTSGPFMTAPFTSVEAIDIVESWFAALVVEPLEPGPRYWSVLRALVLKHDVRGALISDAHLAAVTSNCFAFPMV